MPKRTNEKQQIIEMLKRLLIAQPGVVTESRLLMHRKLGKAREVDVVVEHEVDGHRFTQSFEVVGRGRPADVTWVEQMIEKHSSMCTDRLYLVSWSGFSPDAKLLAELTPHVVPMTIGSVDGSPVVFVDRVDLTLRRMAMDSRLTGGKLQRGDAQHDTGLFSATGELVGTAWELGTLFIRDPEFGRRVSAEAHNHPQRDSCTHFSGGRSFEGAGLYLEADGVGLRELVAIHVVGEMAFSQQVVQLMGRTFGDHIFGHGKFELAGRPHLVVAALDEGLTPDRIAVAPDRAAAKASSKDPAVKS